MEEEVTAVSASAGALVKALRRQVLALEDDLRERSENIESYRAVSRSAYERERDRRRSSNSYSVWRDQQITQSAVAWVLRTVFVRFCEDNDLVSDFFLGNSEGWTSLLETGPESNDRDRLLEAFSYLSRQHRVLRHIFEDDSITLRAILPSPEAAASLVSFWRQPQSAATDFSFSAGGLSTDFLGHLYEGISDHAKVSFGLVRTPMFVADLMLDLAFEPAVSQVGRHRFRAIDPVCGSGTFLLGLFGRLVNTWRTHEPQISSSDLLARVMPSIRGHDINPFAVSITRFRLLIEAVRETGSGALAAVPDFDVNITAEDSLLPDSQASTEVESSFHLVIGEPPYIRARDRARNEAYREAYRTATGNFSLAVPFAERMFDLAVRGDADQAAGYVAQLTSRAFSQHDFGEKLIKEFFPRIQLTHVIDSSGAFIPGHGTPTLILIGRNRLAPRAARVRSVFSLRGEPEAPVAPAEGLVWTAIRSQVNQTDSDSDWVSVSDEPASRFTRHPWALSGAHQARVMQLLERAPHRLTEFMAGLPAPTADLGLTEIFALGRPWFSRHPDAQELSAEMVSGETVLDWYFEPSAEVLSPYDEAGEPLPLDLNSSWGRHLWSMQQPLRGITKPSAEARPWWTWRRRSLDQEGVAGTAFAATSRHTRFVGASNEAVFTRTAPIFRATPVATEQDRLGLIGLLNSSAAEFWLKQASHSFDKAPDSSRLGEEWSRIYRFSPRTLRQLPVPLHLPPDRAQVLESLARRLRAQTPSAVCASGQTPTRTALNEARNISEQLRGDMIAQQEELDWQIYQVFGLLDEITQSELAAVPDADLPPVRLGERAFEIALARDPMSGGQNTWFTRNGITPVRDIPSHWPSEYRELVATRIETITSSRRVGAVERPEYKRQWHEPSWEAQEEAALRNWLLDRCEDRSLWFSEGGFARPLHLHELARALQDDPAVTSVAELYGSSQLSEPDASFEQTLTRMIADESVPYAAVMRYRESGLRKRTEWEQVWELQHREDETGVSLGIPVPPRFTSADFRRMSYWRHRGRYDIPKERFISYPASGGSLLLGWAGWNESDRLRVLLDQTTETMQHPDAASRITPLLVGIQELLTWARPWARRGAAGESLHESVEAARYRLNEIRATFGISAHDLTVWRPHKGTPAW